MSTTTTGAIHLPSLLVRLQRSAARAQLAGNGEVHGLLHTIETRISEAILAAKDAERVLRGGDLDLIRQLQAALAGE